MFVEDEMIQHWPNINGQMNVITLGLLFSEFPLRETHIVRARSFSPMVLPLPKTRVAKKCEPPTHVPLYPGPNFFNVRFEVQAFVVRVTETTICQLLPVLEGIITCAFE